MFSRPDSTEQVESLEEKKGFPGICLASKTLAPVSQSELGLQDLVTFGAGIGRGGENILTGVENQCTHEGDSPFMTNAPFWFWLFGEGKKKKLNKEVQPRFLVI